MAEVFPWWEGSIITALPSPAAASQAAQEQC